MTTQVAITLNGHVYNPAGVTSNVARWFDRTGGIANGFSKLDSSVNRTNGSARNYRINWNLAIPVLATESGECVCAGDTLRSSFLALTATLSPTSTTAERQEVLDQLDDLVADTAFRNSILNLEPVW